MTISVIIPVYKAANYILRCLESVAAQECDDFSIECILVDDCSPDKSMDVIRGFIDQYKGSVSFCIISNTDNQGPSVARNNGLMIAKGDYVFFLWILMIIWRRIVCHPCIRKSINMDVSLTW